MPFEYRVSNSKVTTGVTVINLTDFFAILWGFSSFLQVQLAIPSLGSVLVKVAFPTYTRIQLVFR